MKLDIFNIEEFIKLNHVQEVTSPIALTSAKMPNPNGIFSYDIFGYTTEERKNNFGYIDLRGNYFHPECMKVLNRMGSLGKIAFGEKYAIVVDHKVHVVTKDQLEDFPDAETGVDFFYDNWEQINWSNASILTHEKNTEDDYLSADKKNRLKFFKLLKKEEAFVKYWLVLPPYYRDFNANDMTLGDDINKVYKELLLKTMSLKKGFADEFGFSSVGAATKARIQDLLGILYDISLTPVTGKTIDINTKEMKGNAKRSMIRRNILGRFLDFSASSVIITPSTSTTETVEDFAHFGEVTLPLQSFMAMAKPFFINFCQQFYESISRTISNAKKIDASQWAISEIDKSITRFIKSASEKDLLVYLDYTNRDGDLCRKFCIVTEYDEHKNKIIDRPMTYLDLYYQAAFEIAKDKYAINTRYPVANNQNIYPAKIKPNSTTRTRHIFISALNGSVSESLIEYKNYPYICYDEITKEFEDIKDPNKKPDIYYDIFRATIIGNGVIKSLNADYDGDMMFFRCLFTKEANAEAEKWVWRKSNWFNASGELSRGITKIGKDCCVALYELTKD